MSQAAGDPEPYADALKELDGLRDDRFPDGLAFLFTTGWCAALAGRLAQLVGGLAVAVYDPLDENWEPLPDRPYLVHAGCLVGDKVFDAEGEWDLARWTERWTALGSSDCFVAMVPEADLSDIAAKAEQAMLGDVTEETAMALAAAITASAQTTMPKAQ